MAFTAAEELRLAQTLDEAQVRAVIDCYAHCMDTGNWDLVVDIFTDDAVFEFNATPTNKKTLIGGKAISDYLKDRNRFFKTKTCFVCHTHIIVTRDKAISDTFVSSNVGIGERIAIRGLRYHDELIRGVDGKWRFSMRIHKPLWQHYAEAAVPEVPPS